MNKQTNERRGCLALLFGVGAKTEPRRLTNSESPNHKLESSHEGNVHSGPGGYEGMGYAGGYAADYFADEDHHGEH